MKYYIPTSSLNFNNILSTESVSPAAYYKLRGFGYARWTTIPENEQGGAILLYAAPHSFTRPKSDVEDHPMLIEYTTQEKFPEIKDGVFYSDRTIYLTPSNSRFVFFSDMDRRTALSLSESSRETKLTHLYKARIVVKTYGGEYSVPNGVKDIPVNKDAMIRDVLINKMKGFLYGYFIGANLSDQEEDVKRLNILREIQNVFSSIASSPERKPTRMQSNRLAELTMDFRKTDAFWRELVTAVKGEENATAAVDVLKRHNVEVPLFDLNKLADGIAFGSLENNTAISWINTALAKRQRMMAVKHCHLSADAEEVVVTDGNLTKVSSKVIGGDLENRLFKVWVNEVFGSAKYNGKISPVKEGLSDELTFKAKDVLGAEWDKSAIRAFLNNLRYHVRGGEFDQGWNNGMLSSVAAVILKGDDWDVLLRFVQSKGMTDYRLAFSVYGTLNGFANLPRDFTDILIGEGVEAKYTLGVYSEFHGQLHQEAITEEVENLDVEFDAGQPHESLREKVLKLFDVHLGEFVPVKPYSRQVLRHDLELVLDALGEKTSAGAIVKELERRFKTHGWNSKARKNKNLSRLNELLGQPSAQSLPGLCDDVKPLKSTEKAETRWDELPKTSHSGRSLLMDKGWILKCSAIIGDAKAKKFFMEDMQWVLDNFEEFFQYKGEYRKGRYFNDVDKTNRGVIERIKECMQESECKGPEWKRQLYARIPRQKIIEFLCAEYA